MTPTSAPAVGVVDARERRKRDFLIQTELDQQILIAYRSAWVSSLGALSISGATTSTSKNDEYGSLASWSLDE